ncbi:MAG: hypothetical protein IJX49_01230 [Clostridia bacterium]|nr:hypothetical protein [Clostridia bacterium]
MQKDDIGIGWIIVFFLASAFFTVCTFWGVAEMDSATNQLECLIGGGVCGGFFLMGGIIGIKRKNAEKRKRSTSIPKMVTSNTIQQKSEPIEVKSAQPIKTQPQNQTEEKIEKPIEAEEKNMIKKLEQHLKHNVTTSPIIVSHKKFGAGVINEPLLGDKIYVRFDEGRKMVMFVFPDCFQKGYLTAKGWDDLNTSVRPAQQKDAPLKTSNIIRADSNAEFLNKVFGTKYDHYKQTLWWYYQPKTVVWMENFGNATNHFIHNDLIEQEILWDNTTVQPKSKYCIVVDIIGWNPRRYEIKGLFEYDSKMSDAVNKKYYFRRVAENDVAKRKEAFGFKYADAQQRGLTKKEPIAQTVKPTVTSVKQPSTANVAKTLPNLSSAARRALVKVGQEKGKVFRADTHAEFLNKVFGTNYKAWMKCVWYYSPDIEVWMVRFYGETAGWENRFLNDDTILEVYKGKNISKIGKAGTPYKIPVAIEDDFCPRRYQIMGLFRYCDEESTLTRRIYRRVKDETITPNIKPKN